MGSRREKTIPAGALLAANFEAFLKGERKFDVLFEPTDRNALASFSPTRNHIILNELDNVRSRLVVLTHKDGTLEARGTARPAEVRQRERHRGRCRRVGRLLPDGR